MRDPQDRQSCKQGRMIITIPMNPPITANIQIRAVNIIIPVTKAAARHHL